MRLRQRDLVASIVVVVLGRIVYTYTCGSESLVVSLTLAFYTDFEATETRTPKDSKPYVIHTAKPVPFDVDGDGIVEALIVPSVLTSDALGKSIKTHQWGLKVLDLRPLHNLKTRSNNEPFYPNTLFSSKPIVVGGEKSQTRVPIRITTGQIIIRKNTESLKGSTFTDRDAVATNETTHFYCGIDWNDASSKCANDCPGGSHSECPVGESCYADTSCDVLASSLDQDELQHEELAKTPRGGLPSVVTVWSDGVVSMHSVTADWPIEKFTMNKGNRIQPELELREMWKINPFIDNIGGKSEGGQGRSSLEEQVIDFEELDISLQSNTPIGEHGAVIIAARYRPNGAMEKEIPHSTMVTSYYAIDAFSGKTIWTHRGKTVEERDRIKTMKNNDSATSSTMENTGDDATSEDCLHSYRPWIMHPSTGVLPHMFWDPIVEQGALAEHSELFITHFDRNHHYRIDQLESRRTSTTSKIATPLYAAPNVVVFHNHNGVDVVSLRNGSHICHLSLFSSGLYADVNNDGIIDHLQVVTDSWKPSSYEHSARNTISHDEVSRTSDNLATKMVNRVQDIELNNDVGTRMSKDQLCHALLLSGIPAREELFSIPLCDGRSSVNRATPNLHAAPPLLMEYYDGNTGRPRHDIVFALNSGIVKCYDSHGYPRWSVGPGVKRLPLWEHDERTTAFLGRINFEDATSASTLMASTKRPILIAGSDDMVILSSGRGKILAHKTFPQLSVGRPILSDMSGDGTTDILIMSAKNVRCYRVIVEQGGNIFITIMLIFLTVGIAVAIFYQIYYVKDYRSTDEWIKHKRS